MVACGKYAPLYVPGFNVEKTPFVVNLKKRRDTKKPLMLWGRCPTLSPVAKVTAQSDATCCHIGVIYLVRASIVEAEVADGGDLGVQDLLLSLQLLLHLPGLGEGLGHRLVVVQVGCRGQ